MRKIIFGFSLYIISLSYLFFIYREPIIVFSSGNPQGLVASKLENDFFGLSRDLRIEKFHEYALEDQYKLLIYGNQAQHPPTLGLAIEFAKNGGSAIPFLKEKLTETEVDMTIRDIVITLYFMSRSGSYNVKGDAELMDLLSKKVDSMSGWKDFVQRDIRDINEM